MNTSINPYKIQQAIKWYGKEYTFVRDVLDTYGEGTGETTSNTVQGLFHQGSAGVLSITGGEAASISSKSSQSILALWEDANMIEVEDRVLINATTYKVTARPQNLNELNQFAEISLEAIQ